MGYLAQLKRALQMIDNTRSPEHLCQYRHLVLKSIELSTFVIQELNASLFAGSAVFITTLQSCGIILPHIHPRGTEQYVIISGKSFQLNRQKASQGHVHSQA